MTVTRRLAAGCIETVLCIGGFLLFAGVGGVVFGLLWAILGGIAHGLFLNPKDFVGGWMTYGIPGIVAFAVSSEFVPKWLGPLFDRLERWKTQT